VLAAGTVTTYVRCARVFLRWLPATLAQSLPALSAAQVAEYVLGWAAGRRGKAVNTVTLFPAELPPLGRPAEASGAGVALYARFPVPAGSGIARTDRRTALWIGLLTLSCTAGNI
jgi:hypothetical protein